MFKKEQFDSVKHNPFACKAGQYLWEKYPELARQAAFTNVPNIEDRTANIMQPELSDLHTLLSFIILVVERHGNPLAEIRDYEQRCNEAWTLLGVGPHAKIRVFTNEDGKAYKWFSMLMFEYFVFLNNRDYEEWFSKSILFHRWTKILRDPPGATLDVDEYAKMTKMVNTEMPTLKASIQKLETALFPDARIKKVVHQQAIADSKRWAEQHAEVFQEQTTNVK